MTSFTLRLRELLQPALIPERRKAVLLVGMTRACLGIQLDAEPGLLRESEFSSSTWVPAAHKLIAPGHVVVSEVLLHKNGGRRPPKVDGGTECDWPNRAVRSH